MDRFHVLQITPWPGAPSIIADVMASLVWGLRQLGHQASQSQGQWQPGARHIVLFAHLLDDYRLASLPSDTIIYNLEQIDPLSPLPPSRRKSFSRLQVWDYSLRNIEAWAEVGVRASHLPVCWYPGLERIADKSEKDIDFLFFGAINRRRADVLNGLARNGLQVHVAQGIYGTELDRLVGRSRVCVNVHCYDASILETVRLSHLLANGIPVVSERNSATEIPEIYEPLIRWADLGQFPDACAALLGDTETKSRLSELGRNTLRGQSIDVALQSLLNAPAPMATIIAIPEVTAIPKVLHFVWVGDESKRPDHLIETWRRIHPEMLLRVWGNHEYEHVPWINRQHMEEMAAQELAGVADLMRWEILFREGGIAIDADSQCLKALPEWIFDCEMFAAWENEIERPNLISNGTVGSIAANPFLMKLILDLNRAPSFAGKPAWASTGPLALTEAFRRYKYSNMTILPSHFFLPTHYSGRSYSGKGPVYAVQEWQSTMQKIGRSSA